MIPTNSLVTLFLDLDLLLVLPVGNIKIMLQCCYPVIILPPYVHRVVTTLKSRMVNTYDNRIVTLYYMVDNIDIMESLGKHKFSLSFYTKNWHLHKLSIVLAMLAQ